MNLDGRTMAGIKMGKALILLMKKDEPSIPLPPTTIKDKHLLTILALKAQLASLSKTAYEAYGIIPRRSRRSRRRMLDREHN